MGNLYSTISEFKEVSKSQEEDSKTPILNTPTSPAATPTSNRDNENNMKHLRVTGLVDPRSPTQGVSRTPLEIEERNRRIEKTRITNLLNKENNLEPVTTPTGPPNKDCASFFDPRSPNPEINRTPIALNSNTAVSRRVFQN